MIAISFFYAHFDSIAQSLGGLGLFLLGIIIMSEGLQNLAGQTMRKTLMRCTNTPIGGAFSGFIATAILQSSSAVTVAAVGFVSAGLITFSQSLGIVLGANLGTTLTGWIVAVFGFKMQLGTVSMLFLCLGVTLRLFTKKKIAMFGYTLAGFSVIFMGITMMQNGMSGFEELITPQQLPPDTLIGRLQLVAFGVFFTMLTHSSSAGVAMTLSVLHAGLINFEQAAALVIGMDVGTTFTAVLATIGQSVEARRTGFSHVIYNILTAVVALFFITPFSDALSFFFPTAISHNAEISLVAFHSTFNFLALVLILPFTSEFARLVVKLIREKKSPFSQELDSVLLTQPIVALDAVQKNLYNEIYVLFAHINALLGDTKSTKIDIKQLQFELDKTHTFLDEISLENECGVPWERLLSMIHTLDHMQRLHERCEEEEERAITLKNSPRFVRERVVLMRGIAQILQDMESKQWQQTVKHAYKIKAKLYKQLKPHREAVVIAIARGEIDVQEGTATMQSVRWLQRVSWHIVRITYHYEKALLASGK